MDFGRAIFLLRAVREADPDLLEVFRNLEASLYAAKRFREAPPEKAGAWRALWQETRDLYDWLR